MYTYISYKIQVTEEILKMLIEDEEYLAVYFSGPCDDPEDDCAKILEDLESVDSTMQVCFESMHFNNVPAARILIGMYKDFWFKIILNRTMALCS